MKARTTVLTCAGIVALANACTSASGPGTLPSCGTQGTPVSLAVAAFTSIDPATDSGCVTFAANASSDTVEYLVLPWSGGGALGATAPFALQSATPLASAAVPSVAFQRPSVRPATARGPVAVAFDVFLRGLAHSRAYPAVLGAARTRDLGSEPAPMAPPVVGDKRTFKVCANQTCSSLNTVGAIARTVGTHIAIYVDTLAPSPGLSQAALDSLKSVFDSRLFDVDTATFGGVSDIDANSVVIVLMTGSVNHLVTTAQCNNEGFVAGFFFSGDIDPSAASTYNNGEIFYSIVADPAGTLSCAHSTSQVEDFLPVTFVHEFQHMINFVQHVRVSRAEPEESWLDEGLARLAEEIAGRSYLASGDTASFSRFAIDPVFDAYLYLQSPVSSPLLFAADTGGLAPLGAGWMFTRFIVDQFGDSVPHRLVQSGLHGAANVSAQTGEPFDVTVTHWALANWVGDLPGFTAPAELKYTLWNFHKTFASLHQQDPNTFPTAYPLVPPIAAGSDINLSGKLKAGSGSYVRAMQRPGAAAFTLQFSNGSAGAVSPAVVPRLNIIRIR